jgi:chromatin remodeling complex protein RSC6
MTIDGVKAKIKKDVKKMVRVKKVPVAVVTPVVCEQPPVAAEVAQSCPVVCENVCEKVVEPPIKKMSGLHMLRKLTPEAAEFFGKQPDELMSRVQITTAINKYIKDHALQKDEKDKRFISPDDALKTLLKLTPENLDDKGQFMFKDVQRYYSHLFADKPVKKPSV